MPAEGSLQADEPGSRRATADGTRNDPLRAEDRSVRLQDPRQIRALAHPARMAIIDALASGDELTATECAALTALSPSATAYHLKLLERYGFAEPAPARSDGRERPWRAAGRGTRVDLDSSTPAGAAAAAVVGGAYFDRSRALAAEFLATMHEEPREWQEVTLLGNADLWLTVDESREVIAALTAILEPYRDRTHSDRPDSTRRVRIMNMVLPHRTQ